MLCDKIVFRDFASTKNIVPVVPSGATHRIECPVATRLAFGNRDIDEGEQQPARPSAQVIKMSEVLGVMVGVYMFRNGKAVA
jgi:hypothetical protein